MKIVSLIPSATEIISSLGLINNLIGVSHECDNPKEVIYLPKLTKSVIKVKQSSLEIDKDIGNALMFPSTELTNSSNI
jgi:iron complex transport system substrate-binding protein